MTSSQTKDSAIGVRCTNEEYKNIPLALLVPLPAPDEGLPTTEPDGDEDRQCSNSGSHLNQHQQQD